MRDECAAAAEARALVADHSALCRRSAGTDDFVAQVEQALANVVAVLAEGGAEPQYLVRLTWHVTDNAAYVARQREVGEASRRVIGRHYPAMTLVVVAALPEDGALVDTEAPAVVAE